MSRPTVDCFFFAFQHICPSAPRAQLLTDGSTRVLTRSASHASQVYSSERSTPSFHFQKNAFEPQRAYSAQVDSRTFKSSRWWKTGRPSPMLIWPAELSCHRVEITRLPWMAELGALAKADFFFRVNNHDGKSVPSAVDWWFRRLMCYAGSGSKPLSWRAVWGGGRCKWESFLCSSNIVIWFFFSIFMTVRNSHVEFRLFKSEEKLFFSCPQLGISETYT